MWTVKCKFVRESWKFEAKTLISVGDNLPPIALFSEYWKIGISVVFWAVSKKTDTKWNRSKICGTAPPKSKMLFQDVEQCVTFNCGSHGSGSSHKLLFRIIVMHLVCCKTINLFLLDYRVPRKSIMFFLALCSTICGIVPHKVELLHFLSVF